MGLYGKLEKDVPIKASASKFHEIFHKRPHHISNVSSDIIHGVDLHEGEWGKVGSIVCWRYFLDGKSRATKEIIEEVDEENNAITFKVIEGHLKEHYEKFRFKIKCIPKEKGSIVHWCLEYEKLHDEIPETHGLLMDLCVKVSKDLDAYLNEGGDKP
ncbi:MLP-like protein 43 [Cucumis melo var. makuwa]|uniref:MLP-like protein 43 n=1 Tax=Cucumis melo var. makuwa TaxID=1194695 RepID=A0A5D3DJS2_CUCMM|nr:MLP-like protein 43 [Cucumis melo var. makuwa]TYK23640.1 MLP-like protein 43 [Cucumis melo var. makuwa]